MLNDDFSSWSRVTGTYPTTYVDTYTCILHNDASETVADTVAIVGFVKDLGLHAYIVAGKLRCISLPRRQCNSS